MPADLAQFAPFARNCVRDVRKAKKMAGNLPFSKKMDREITEKVAMPRSGIAPSPRGALQ
jgi:hypothetical protein